MSHCVKVLKIEDDNGSTSLTLEHIPELKIGDKIFVISEYITNLDNTDSITLINAEDSRAFGYIITKSENNIISINLEWNLAYVYDGTRILNVDETIWISRTHVKNGYMYGGRLNAGAFGRPSVSNIVFNRPPEAANVYETVINYKGCEFNNGAWLGGSWKQGSFKSKLNIFDTNGEYEYGPNVWLQGDYSLGTWENGTWYTGTFKDFIITDSNYLSISGNAEHDLDSVWKNGYWKGGVFEDGYFEDGLMTADFDISDWLYGDFRGGVSRNVRWHNGVISGSKWNSEINININEAELFGGPNKQLKLKISESDFSFYFLERLNVSDKLSLYGLGDRIPIIKDGITRYGLDSTINNTDWLFNSITLNSGVYEVILDPEIPSFINSLNNFVITAKENILPLKIHTGEWRKGLANGGEIWYCMLQHNKGQVTLNNINAPILLGTPYNITLTPLEISTFPTRGYATVYRMELDNKPDVSAFDIDRYAWNFKIKGINGNNLIIDSTTIDGDNLVGGNSLVVQSNGANTYVTDFVWLNCKAVNCNWNGPLFQDGVFTVSEKFNTDSTLETAVVSTWINGDWINGEFDNGYWYSGTGVNVIFNKGIIDNSLGDTNILYLNAGNSSDVDLNLSWDRRPILLGGLIRNNISYSLTYCYGSILNNEWYNGIFYTFYDPFAGIDRTGGVRHTISNLSGPEVESINASITTNMITFTEPHRLQKGYLLTNSEYNWDPNNIDEFYRQVKVDEVLSPTSINVSGYNYNTKDYNLITVQPKPFFTERTFNSGLWYNGVFGLNETTTEDGQYFVNGTWINGTWINGRFSPTGIFNKLVDIKAENIFIHSGHIMGGEIKNAYVTFGAYLSNDHTNLKIGKLNNFKHTHLQLINLNYDKNLNTFFASGECVKTNSNAGEPDIPYNVPGREGSVYKINQVFTPNIKEIYSWNTYPSVGNAMIEVSSDLADSANSKEIFIHGSLNNVNFPGWKIYGFHYVTKYVVGPTNYLVFQWKPADLGIDIEILNQYLSSTWVDCTGFIKMQNVNKNGNSLSFEFISPNFNEKTELALDTHYDVLLSNVSIKIKRNRYIIPCGVIEGNRINEAKVGQSPSIEIKSTSSILPLSSISINRVSILSANHLLFSQINNVNNCSIKDLDKSIISNIDLNNTSINNSLIEGRDEFGGYTLDRKCNWDSNTVKYKKYNQSLSLYDLRVVSISNGSLSNANDTNRMKIEIDVPNYYDTSNNILDWLKKGNLIYLHQANSYNAELIGSTTSEPIIISDISTPTSITLSNTQIDGNENIDNSTVNKYIIEIIKPYVSPTGTAPGINNPISYGNNYDNTLSTEKYNWYNTRIGFIAWNGCNIDKTPSDGMYGLINGGIYNTNSDLNISQSELRASTSGKLRWQLYKDNINSTNIVKNLNQEIAITLQGDLFSGSDIGKLLYIKSNNPILNGYWPIVNSSYYNMFDITIVTLKLNSIIWGLLDAQNTDVIKYAFFNLVRKKDINNSNNAQNYLNSNQYPLVDSTGNIFWNTNNNWLIFNNYYVTNTKAWFSTFKYCIFGNTSGNTIAFSYNSKFSSKCKAYTLHTIEGTWSNGVWFAGHVSNIKNKGLWLNGVWNSGTWVGGVWMSYNLSGSNTNKYLVSSSIWNSGNFRSLNADGTINNNISIWNGGTWNSNKLQNNYSYGNITQINDGIIGSSYNITENAISNFYGGIWNRGLFKGGIVHNGTFNSLNIENRLDRDLTVFNGGYFKQGTWNAGTVNPDTTNLELGPIINLPDTNNEARLYCIFGNLNTSGYHGLFLGTKIKPLLNPVLWKSGLIKNGLFRNTSLDSIYTTDSSGIGEFNLLGKYDNTNIPIPYKLTLDAHSVTPDWTMAITQSSPSIMLFTKTPPDNVSLNMANYGFYVGMKFQIRDVLPTNASTQTQVNSIQSKPSIPYYTVKTISGVNVEIEEVFQFSDLNNVFFDKFKIYDIKTWDHGRTILEKGEVLNSIWKAGIVEPTEKTLPHVLFRNSVWQTGIVKDTGFTTNNPFTFNNSIWYTGKLMKGSANDSVFNSGYCWRWQNHYNNTDKLRTYFDGPQILSIHRNVKPEMFYNTLFQYEKNNSNVWNGIVSPITPDEGEQKYRAINIPSINLYKRNDFPNFNPVGALSTANFTPSTNFEFSLIISTSGNFADAELDSERKLDTVTSISLGALFNTVNNAPDIEKGLKIGSGIVYNNKNINNPVVINNNVLPYTFNGTLNSDVDATISVLRRLCDTTERNTVSGGVIIGVTSIPPPQSTIVETPPNTLFHLKRFVGTVDNFMSYIVNCNMYGCTFNGGIFGNGLFTSNSNRQGLFTRGLWLSGIFGIGAETTNNKPVFSAFRAACEWNVPTNLSTDIDYYTKYGSNVNTPIQDPRTRTGYNAFYMARSLEYIQDKESTLETYQLPIAKDGGAFKEHTTSAWFSRVQPRPDSWRTAYEPARFLNNEASIFHGIFLSGIFENSWKANFIDKTTIPANIFLRNIPLFSEYAEFGNNISYFDFKNGNYNLPIVNLKLNDTTSYTLLNRAGQSTFNGDKYYLPLLSLAFAYTKEANGNNIGTWNRNSYNFILPGHKYSRKDSRRVLWKRKEMPYENITLSTNPNIIITPGIPLEDITNTNLTLDISLDSLVNNDWRNAQINVGVALNSPPYKPWLSIGNITGEPEHPNAIEYIPSESLNSIWKYGSPSMIWGEWQINSGPTPNRPFLK